MNEPPPILLVTCPSEICAGENLGIKCLVKNTSSRSLEEISLRVGYSEHCEGSETVTLGEIAPSCEQARAINLAFPFRTGKYYLVFELISRSGAWRNDNDNFILTAIGTGQPSRLHIEIIGNKFGSGDKQGFGSCNEFSMDSSTLAALEESLLNHSRTEAAPNEQHLIMLDPISDFTPSNGSKPSLETNITDTDLMPPIQINNTSRSSSSASATNIFIAIFVTVGLILALMFHLNSNGGGASSKGIREGENSSPRDESGNLISNSEGAQMNVSNDNSTKVINNLYGDPNKRTSVSELVLRQRVEAEHSWADFVSRGASIADLKNFLAVHDSNTDEVISEITVKVRMNLARQEKDAAREKENFLKEEFIPQTKVDEISDADALQEFKDIKNNEIYTGTLKEYR